MALRFTYDIHRTWEENAARGPQLVETPPIVPETPMKSFLGLPVRSRLGIAAGLLLNRKWVQPYADRGFDLLTYKTVRSRARPCYPLPNWVFVRDVGDGHGPVEVIDGSLDDPAAISSSVCFGMPSVEPAAWRDDVRDTCESLQAGQLLIVSIVGSPGEETAAPAMLDALADDFAQCATWAMEAGAPVVEANLSCPNVCSAEGSLYQDPVASRIVTQRIREAIGATRLLLKVGSFTDDAQLDRFLRAVDGHADGVTLVNCLRREVLRADGMPAFGEAYRYAGVLGRAIHEPSVRVVEAVRRRIDRDALALAVVAVGGASTVPDLADFFSAGADAVLCGSSPMYLPHLAIEAKRLHPEW